MSTLKSINVQHPSATTINLVNDSSGNVAVGGTLTVGGVAAMAVAPSTAGNVVDWPAHQAHEFIALEPGSRLVNIVKG